MLVAVDLMPMRETAETLRQHWLAGSHRGVHDDMDYPAHRRVVLVNQMALLGAAFSVVYAVFNLIYAPTVLWPVALAALPLIGGYVAVVVLNHRRAPLAARLLLVAIPAIQITLSAWLFGSRAGIQLYFFVLWTALFLLFSREERWLSFVAAALWIGLYLWIQLRFDVPRLQLAGYEHFLDLVFFLNALGTFALLGSVVALFYLEIERTEAQLQQEYERSETLLSNILPASVAERLKDNPGTLADSFSEATLLFADIVGFTRLAGRLPPDEVVDLLNAVFSRFDAVAEAHGLEKIKTIGDEYMLAGGLPLPRPGHTAAVADAALAMQAAIAEMNAASDHDLSLRVGIHTGEVVAGVIGSRKFSYDVWGDTVNTASRMQSQGLPGRIQVTEATWSRLDGAFEFRRRGTIRVRGKGRMPTWFLLRRSVGA